MKLPKGNSGTEQVEKIKSYSDIEPVAVAYNYDGHGYQFIDNGSGSDWFEMGTSQRDAVVLVDLEDVISLYNYMAMLYIDTFSELQVALKKFDEIEFNTKQRHNK